METINLDYNDQSFELDVPDGASEEEIMGIFQRDYANMQMDARNRLKIGYEWTGRRTKRGRRIPYSTQESIARNLPAALGVSPNDVDVNKGIPAKQRAILSGLQQDTSRFSYLAQEYGRDNVNVINFAGKEEFVVRGEDKKWRMTDPKGVIEFSDFTSDIAGGVLPTLAGAAAGVTTALSGVGITGVAAASNLAEATMGAAQDAAVRNALGLSIDPGEIAKRRGINATLGFGLELATMGTVTNAPKLFVKKMGIDNATESAKFLSKNTGEKLPTQMYLGEASVAQIKDVAERYPGSATAKLWEDLRTQIGQKVDDQVGMPKVSAAESDVVLQRNLESIAKSQTEEIDRLKMRLSDVGESKGKIIAQSRDKVKGAETLSAEKANKIFVAEKKRRSRNLVASGEISTTKAGEAFQNDLFKQFLKVDRQKNALYDKAYELAGNTTVSGNDVAEIYSSIASLGTEQFDDDLVKILGDVAAKRGLKSADELVDLGDVEVPFKLVNEVIQSAAQRAKFNTIGVTPEAAKFQKLATKMSALRDEMLQQKPGAKEAFDNAQLFYRNEYLKFSGGLTKKALSLKPGQGLREAREAFGTDPTNIPVPGFEKDGLEVVASALRTPGAAKEMIEMSSDPMAARKALRQLWQQRNGLTSRGGLEQSVFKLNDNQREMVRMLWPQQRAGKNVKLETFRDMEKLFAGKDDFLDGISDKTFKELMGTNTELAENEIKKLAAEELAVKDQIDGMKKSAIQKMLNKGALEGTAEDNIRILMDTMDSLDAAQIREVKTLLADQSPANVDMLVNSTLAHVLKKSNKLVDEAQLGKYGFQLWNPQSMEKILVKDEGKLKLLLGEPKYKLLNDWNNALKTVSVDRLATTGGGGRINAATTGQGPPSFFLSGLTDWAKNAWTNAMLTASIKAPTRRILMDPKAYDDMLAYLINASALTAPGIGALANQMEDSVEVKTMIQATYLGLINDIREGEALREKAKSKQAQQPTPQQPRPSSAP